ncbi:hypothetical protein GGR55DRAFT_418659 [Xylaria sp. FL0064]|nr:hypothetical protein GGR55DRAFT_418659 [Xylaria sp. FL0064]
MTLSPHSSTVLLVRLMSSFSVLAAISPIFLRCCSLLPYIKYALSLLYPDPGPLYSKSMPFMGLQLGHSLASRRFLTAFSHLTGDSIPPSLSHMSLTLQLLTCSEACLMGTHHQRTDVTFPTLYQNPSSPRCSLFTALP